MADDYQDYMEASIESAATGVPIEDILPRKKVSIDTGFGVPTGKVSKDVGFGIPVAPAPVVTPGVVAPVVPDAGQVQRERAGPGRRRKRKRGGELLLPGTMDGPDRVRFDFDDQSIPVQNVTGQPLERGQRVRVRFRRNGAFVEGIVGENRANRALRGTVQTDLVSVIIDGETTAESITNAWGFTLVDGQRVSLARQPDPPYDLVVIGSEDDATVEANNIANDAVDGDAIADNSITNPHMTDNSIDSPEYVNDSMDTAHYAPGSMDLTGMGNNSVDTNELVTDSVNSSIIDTNGVALSNMSNSSVDTGNLVAASVDNSGIVATNAIVLANMSNDSVDTAEIQSSAVDTSELATNSITLVKMDNNSVDTNELVSSSVDSSGVVANNAIVIGNMASNSVDTDELVALSVDTGELAATSVTTAKVATGQDADKITTGILDAVVVRTGSSGNWIRLNSTHDLDFSISGTVRTRLDYSGTSFRINCSVGSATSLAITADFVTNSIAGNYDIACTSFTVQDVYDTTTSTQYNVNVHTNGSLRRSTAGPVRLKENIRPLSLDAARAMLAADPVIFDHPTLVAHRDPRAPRGHSLVREVETDRVGLIAEQIDHMVDTDVFLVSRDAEGRTENVQYQAFTAAHNLVLEDHEDRVTRLEKAMAEAGLLLAA